MALSRPFVLAVVGALLAVATFASLRSAADRAQAEEAPAAPTVVKNPPATDQVEKDPATSTPAKPDSDAKPTAKDKPKAKKPAAVSGVPPKVGRALAARRTVVLFFRQPAADDAATAAAVRSVRGMKGVSVFSAPISQLGRYRRVVASLGVSQAPAVVVVGKDRKARLLEGFIDSGTLRQGIKDQK